MNETKLRGAMGFAMRAGKCIAGDFACERAGLPCFTVVDLGRAIGKDGRMVAAVTDERFAQMICDAYASDKNAN